MLKAYEVGVFVKQGFVEFYRFNVLTFYRRGVGLNARTVVADACAVYSTIERRSSGSGGFIGLKEV